LLSVPRLIETVARASTGWQRQRHVE
jgi:hypothetical protein